MVFGDLGDSTPKAFPVRAPVQERFIAFCFDVLLILPCVSLASLLCLKFVDGLSELEHFSAFAFLALVQWVWVQAFFLAWRGATPGKEILKLKVVSADEPGATPSWDQALLRSMLWMFEMFYVGIPMLKVFREEWRRPFHDRLASTVVISLKDADSFVTEHERNLSKYLLYGANGFFTVWFATLFLFVAPKVRDVMDRAPASASAAADVPGCKDLLRLQSERYGRAEQAILLFGEKQIDQSCLEDEIELAMDTGDATERAWASLAMAHAHVSDRKFAQEYLDEACELAPGDTGPCRNALAFYGGEPAKGSSLVEAWQEWKKAPEKRAAFLAEFPFVAEARAVEALAEAGDVDGAADTFAERREEWPDRLRRSMSAWVCLAQLTRECGTKKLDACEAVVEQVKEKSVAKRAWEQNETAGWIEYQRCQNEPRGSLDEWRSLADARPDLYQYAKLLLGDRENGIPQGQAARFVDDATIPAALRSRALVHLAHEVARKGNESGIDLLTRARAVKEDGPLGKLAEARVRESIEGGGIVVIGPSFRPVKIRKETPQLKPREERLPASHTEEDDR